MAVCNLFKKFTKETGNFLTFSQYADDLTKSATETVNYQIIPSKFVAMDIDYKNFGESDDYNTDIPKYLQNTFENSCAFLKSNLKKDIHGMEWNPQISSDLFWRCMVDSGILTIKDKEIQQNNISFKVSYIDQVRWCGDINIQSYDEKDGVGYSEIYCYIPNDAKSITYCCEQILEESNDSYIINNNNIIEGYTLKDFLYKGLLSGILIPPIYYNYKKKYDFAFLNDSYNKYDNDVDNFNINTIVILYDIVAKQSDGSYYKLYESIPLGIYFTGLINNDGTVTNSITKYVKNEDIYNEGTSYGLRICSKYTVSPNNLNIIDVDLSLDSDNYSAFSQTMSKMSEVLDKMEDIINKTYEMSQINKDLLAIFKNGRTNVPYLKNINGKNYWFVNGKNMGVEGTSVLSTMDNGLVSMHDNEVDNTLNNLK